VDTTAELLTRDEARHGWRLRLADLVGPEPNLAMRAVTKRLPLRTAQRHNDITTVVAIGSPQLSRNEKRLTKDEASPDCDLIL
jgi:hypothetical protein